MKITQDSFAQVRRATTDQAPTPMPPYHQPYLPPRGGDVYHTGGPYPREPWLPQPPVYPTPAFPLPRPALPGKKPGIDIKIGDIPEGRKIIIIIGEDAKQSPSELDLLA